jgi:hypothetical protein
MDQSDKIPCNKPTQELLLELARRTILEQWTTAEADWLRQALANLVYKGEKGDPVHTQWDRTHTFETSFKNINTDYIFRGGKSTIKITISLEDEDIM